MENFKKITRSYFVFMGIAFTFGHLLGTPTDFVNATTLFVVYRVLRYFLLD